MRVITIGRKAELNTIVINDQHVSSQHLQIVKNEDGNIFLLDLDSTNGTFVNGNRVSETQLFPGDIVKIGQTTIPWESYFEPVHDSTDDSISIEEPAVDYTVTKTWFQRNLFALIVAVMAITAVSYFIYHFTKDPTTKKNNNDTVVKYDPDRKITYSYDCLGNTAGNSSTTDFLKETRDAALDLLEIEDVSVQEQMEAGDQMHKDIARSYRFINSGSQYTKLQNILKKLTAQVSDTSEFRYKIFLIDDSTINGFTFGGRIYIFTGLMNFVESDDELAAIIGHEMGHNELGHIKAELAEYKLSLEAGELGEFLYSLDAFLTQCFNQKNEVDCDYFGVGLMIKAGYDPCDVCNLWDRMQKLEAQHDEIPDFLRTHPYSDGRRNCLQEHILTNYDVNCN